MDRRLLFEFSTDISGINIPQNLNNPFGGEVPEIAKIAAREFQAFIATESQGWEYNFLVRKGKMFGVLVVQNKGGAYQYLGTVSGRLAGDSDLSKLVPTIFDHTVGDFFMDKGMTELTEMSSQITHSNNPAEIISLKDKRKKKSIALQNRLFENYHFLSLSGKEKSLLQIFADSSNGIPSSGAGECAAPKLLQYAIKRQLSPISLTEFWWGKSNTDKVHKEFYPACESKCRPILEYMLEDTELYLRGTQLQQQAPPSSS